MCLIASMRADNMLVRSSSSLRALCQLLKSASLRRSCNVDCLVSLLCWLSGIGTCHPNSLRHKPTRAGASGIASNKLAPGPQGLPTARMSVHSRKNPTVSSRASSRVHSTGSEGIRGPAMRHQRQSLQNRLAGGVISWHGVTIAAAPSVCAVRAFQLLPSQ